MQSQAPIEAFTMSVDRGFLGRNPLGEKDDDFNELAMHHKSMENLATGNNNGGRKKNTGLELVRLLRVGTVRYNCWFK